MYCFISNGLDISVSNRIDNSYIQLSGAVQWREVGMGITIGNGAETDCSKTSTSNEANREIAKLLLTLHASGNSAPPTNDISAFNDNPKAEDLSVRITSNGNSKNYQQSMPTEMALDLTSSSNRPAKAMSLTS